MSDRFSPPPASGLLGLSRNAVIASGVVLFHVAALWALQSGLIRKAAEVVIPVEILSELIEPPKPKEPPPPPPPPPPQAPQPKVTKAPPPPRPMAVRTPAPAPDAPRGDILPPPPAPAPMAPPSPPAPPAPPAPPPAPPAPPSVQLPSSDAEYLQNPKPVFPAMSRRLGEQGKTVVSVLIGVDGLPKSATIRTSSGYERLDEAARAAVMSWRFVPGKRNGVVEAMEFSVPINWVLK